MTTKIEQLIEDIRVKHNGLKKSMLDEQQKAVSLQNQLEEVKGDLANQMNENAQLKSEIERLQSEIETVKNVSIIPQASNPVGVDNNEIDELVREIDYCIEQLKR